MSIRALIPPKEGSVGDGSPFRVGPGLSNRGQNILESVIEDPTTKIGQGGGPLRPTWIGFVLPVVWGSLNETIATKVSSRR